MKNEIKKLAEHLVSDIEEMRNSEMKASERLGAEVMALNALCNAEKTLKNKCQCEEQHLRGLITA